MDIIGGELVSNETNKNAKGGTELIATALSQKLDQALLSRFQIVNSRVRELKSDFIPIFVAHDLPGDPESEFLKTRQDLFFKYVFVSNWQMIQYIAHYNLPWERCVVIPNAIEPFTNSEKSREPGSNIKLAYWSTPHRGLDILVPVFDKLCQKHDNIELDVYSSYNLYGWGERDKAFQDLFDQCRQHPKINYHGTVDNNTIRRNLETTDILAYPSIWLETSCLVLIEAMAAGLVCVHPNFGALPETAANLTEMYQWSPDKRIHAETFYTKLDECISSFGKKVNSSRLSLQRDYANQVYGWHTRVEQWNAFLKRTLAEFEAVGGRVPRSAVFSYSA